VDDIVVIRVLEEDEEPPADAVALPALEDMEPEEGVRHLMEYWGLDEADARFYLAIARGEIDGDIIAVRDEDAKPAVVRRDRSSA
jgi:hypothetical protein